MYTLMMWSVNLNGGPQRVNHASIAVGSKIYSFGGFSSSQDYGVDDKIDVYVFDTETLQWSLLPYTSDEMSSIPLSVYGHTVVEYNEMIYLWGGRNEHSYTNTVYSFDFVKRIWSAVETSGNIPHPVDGHTASVVGHYMYVFGGYDEVNELPSSVLHRLNFRTKSWELLENDRIAPTHHDFHTATVVGDRIYVFGGRTIEELDGDPIELYTNKIVYFDTDILVWVLPKTQGKPPSCRRSHSCVAYKGELYVFGGYNSLTREHMRDLFKFSPATNMWTEIMCVGNGPEPRRRHCSCVVGDQMFIFGGSSPHDEEEYLKSPKDAEEDYQKLKDLSDLHILDFTVSLKRLCQLVIISHKLSLSEIPIFLAEEIKAMTTNSTITRIELEG